MWAEFLSLKGVLRFSENSPELLSSEKYLDNTNRRTVLCPLLSEFCGEPGDTGALGLKDRPAHV